ncbi:putative DCC family thiol-disulfide oxidoreductase YuxK [Salirhabdus euzebyi]|uniref:Putative DCC family thiol-disulfide oxidoreductase YuxK n=1 Tax=Salirhabdus euzebyi TaxID=394506 RepID=A0A841Q382_9BACI|nr:DUF393 domain-containing protein [Salirhabdus euzebyi]MBB6452843.1 putative DCC family thiol-disulfide oxidoreductase YuxK [Salirhabdus euzebyi]
MNKRKNLLLVFFDSWCPLCQKAKKNIEKADKHNAIQFLSFRDADVFEEYQLDGKNVENRIYSIDLSTNTDYSGIHTVLQIVKKIPKYRVLVPFISLSIFLGLGQRVYDYIASKRELVPVGKCSDQGCSIHYPNTDQKKDKE